MPKFELQFEDEVTGGVSFGVRFDQEIKAGADRSTLTPAQQLGLEVIDYLRGTGLPIGLEPVKDFQPNRELTASQRLALRGRR